MNNNMMGWQADYVRRHFEDSIRVKQEAITQCLPSILMASDVITRSLENSGKLMLCGNGGSAADCQHMAAEFTNVLSRNYLRGPLPALALTTDTSFLTSHSNDFGFDTVFARQVQALGRAGDVLLGISTSGTSSNVIKAVEAARRMGIITISLTGARGALLDMVDVNIAIPSDGTQHIQESHLAVEHILCHLVERSLATGGAA